MNATIIVFAVAIGFLCGGTLWVILRTNKFLMQPNDIWPALEQFWMVAHDPHGFLWALIPIVIGFCAFMVTAVNGLNLFAGPRRNERGARLVSMHVLKKLTNDKKADSKQLTLGGVPIPIATETNHFLMVGSTGTGKSNAQHELLSKAIARNDRVIVVDPGGQSLARFWKPGDRLLNPFDARAEKWFAFREIQRLSDFDRVASAMIPRSSGDDETWRARARTMLSEIMQSMAESGEEVTPQLLLWYVSAASRDQLTPLLGGKSSAALLQPDAGRFLDSVRGVLAEYVRPHAMHPSGDFTLRDWLKSETGNLFLTWRDDQVRTLRPLITCWLDLLISSMLSGQLKGRPIWLFIDELGSLEQMSGLETALTRGRKHGLRVVACLQSTSQLTDVYGKSRSETLRSCFRNLLALGGSATDPDTAEAMSLGLGDLEVEEREISIAQDGQRRSTTESKQVRKRRLVLPSEIQNLPVNTGFLKLAGEFPVALIKIQLPGLADQQSAFEEN